MLMQVPLQLVVCLTLKMLRWLNQLLTHSQIATQLNKEQFSIYNRQLSKIQIRFIVILLRLTGVYLT